MADFKAKCQEYFDTTDFYEVLNLKKGASEKEIKKAYHKLSLLVHPDRVDESQKEAATEKFKVLGRIHSILQDKEKRKVYDQFGEFDEEGDAAYNWMEYWRNLFKKIEIEDIQNYEQEYIGSELEYRDLKRAYVASHGNMDKILELVSFSNCDSEPRFKKMIRKMVDDGEVEEYEWFFNEPERKRKRRHKRYEEEKKEAAKIDTRELEKEMAAKSEQHAKNFCDMISALEEKYGKKEKKKSITNGIEPPAKKKRVTRARK